MISIVTDSTADVPRQWLDQYQIGLIPAYVNFSTESFPDDGVALSHDQFYQRLAASSALATTSAPPVGVAIEKLEAALEKADQVVVYTIAAAFSSIYNTVRLAIEKITSTRNIDAGRITLCDSGFLSMGLGWQVLAAARCAANGGKLSEVLAAGQAARAKVNVWATANTLEYLRRGGRINAAVAGIGTLLQIKPIINLRESQVNIIQRVRTMPKAEQALVDLAAQAAPLGRIALMHSNYPAGAAAMQKALAALDALPAEVVTVDVSTAIGTQFGPGALGIAIEKA
jgi:DegV family protein with EDD domain